ncbi:hypothetical protein [Deinococcus aestuarii]|uniref:hypothetical protein n=1 Tax=Deinococcus aestuarii TaxID=2774531 RepID=UPI001C0D2DD7|nr:hypothetical protein [Deinococcus aestuarii]
MPFTHAGVVAAAPAEHHAVLMTLAQGGISRADLRAAARLRTAPQLEAPVGRVLSLGQRLSRRLLARLSPKDLQVLERWLDKMPRQVRQALEQESTGRD